MNRPDAQTGFNAATAISLGLSSSFASPMKHVAGLA
jgi:hypothetical protein